MAPIEGEVYKIAWDGLAVYFRSESLPHPLGFTLDKISGYRGEYPSELGLYEGSRVTVELDPETQMIAKVHLQRPTRRHRRLFF